MSRGCYELIEAGVMAEDECCGSCHGEMNDDYYLLDGEKVWLCACGSTYLEDKGHTVEWLLSPCPSQEEIDVNR